MPRNLPSSFKLERGPHDYAQIKYEVKVKFGGGDAGWFRGEFKLKEEDKIYVVQVYPPDFRQTFRQQSFELNSCCCIDKGKMRIQAGFEKTIYTPGEIARFKMAADAGDSEVDVTDVQGQCNRWVTIRCQGHTKTWRDVVDRVSMGELDDGDHSGVVMMTPRINAQIDTMTSFGNLIKCQYFLSAVCKMELCCACAEDPAIRLPILVCQFPPQQQQMQMLKPINTPMGWNPQMMQANLANLMINNASQYPNYFNGQGMQQNPMGNNNMGYAQVINPNDGGKMAANMASLLNNARNQGNMNQPIDPRAMLNTNYPAGPGGGGGMNGGGMGMNGGGGMNGGPMGMNGGGMNGGGGMGGMGGGGMNGGGMGGMGGGPMGMGGNPVMGGNPNAPMGGGPQMKAPADQNGGAGDETGNHTPMPPADAEGGGDAPAEPAEIEMSLAEE